MSDWRRVMIRGLCFQVERSRDWVSISVFLADGEVELVSCDASELDAVEDRFRYLFAVGRHEWPNSAKGEATK